MAGNTIRVVARIVARKEKAGQVRDILTGLVEPTRAETGCIGYELLMNKTDLTDFTFVEEWTNDAAIDLHMRTPHIVQALVKLPDLIAAAPDIRRYVVVK
jgi:quinol monooxygenase YgiN